MKRILYFIFMTVSAVFVMSLSASALNTAGRVETSGGRLNIRTAPAGTVIGSINNGSWLTVKGSTDGWYLVEYEDNKEAYVSKTYVKNYTSSIDYTVKLSSGRLNVRSGASMAHSVIDSLNNGERVVAIKDNGDWCEIIYRANKRGFVAKAYLEKTASQSQKYKAVKLAVPSFKQTDSRWKSYPIGTTGGTIGTIGCTTTALAMTESYHKGYTITPPEMAKRLSYSASGSLYWPTYYNVINAPQNYLEELYKALSSGKPVVFGMKTAKGNQHWVTVYAYEGGSSLTPEGFLVNDPGSSSRTTLRAVLEAYPNPYRLVYRK